MTPEQIIEQEKRREAQANKSGLMSPNDIIAAEKSRLANSAAGSFYTMRDVQPERASKVISLADRMGAQPDFVDKNLETLEHGEEEQKRKGLLDQFPKVAEYFANPYRAAEAKDSAQYYAEIERIYTERPKASRPSFGARLTGATRLALVQSGVLNSRTRSAAAGVGSVGSLTLRGTGESARAFNYVDFLTGMLGVQYVGTEEDDRTLVEKGIDALAGGGGVTREQAKAPVSEGQFGVGIPGAQALIDAGNATDSVVSAIRPNEQDFADKVFEAVGQIGAVIGLTGLTRSPVPAQVSFAAMGADQQAQALRGVGIDPRDRPDALVKGAMITGATEMMRLGSMLRVIPSEARNRVANNIFGRILGQGLEEGAQEMVEGIGQNLVTMGFDEEATVLDGVIEQGIGRAHV